MVPGGAGKQDAWINSMFHVYVLISRKNGRRYVGMTTDPELRLEAHNSGQVKSTAPFAPYDMRILQVHESGRDARKAEKYFKSGFGRKAMDRLLARG